MFSSPPLPSSSLSSLFSPGRAAGGGEEVAEARRPDGQPAMRRRRPRGEGELLLHGGGAAVALCRDRAPLLADAIRHRYALADAHRAYAAALHDFLRGVQVLPSSSTCSTGRGTTAERSPSSRSGRRSVAARAAS
uniref:DUF630 domain-containing protein n=1 Tax=Oryza barthii TaxID=65489 RepID=A0A0D3H930_9ORYZ